jgi:conjugative relaxase-like TrwC/TraI family protein
LLLSWLLRWTCVTTQVHRELGDALMMTVHKIAAAEVGGYADYLASHGGSGRGDYYLGKDGQRSHAVGRWHGRGAAALGLGGDVARDQLLRVWAGRDPQTGRLIVKRSPSGDHVAAIDCTFSAPKSVSVVWALSDQAHRERLEAAQDRAVEVALLHIEKNAPLVRRRVDGAITHEKAAGLAVARFRHHTSRLCKDQHETGAAPDPQLHDHCVVANVALRDAGALAVNGRWGAIDSRELFRIGREAGAVYRAELAAGMQELGYRVHREGRFFEVSGISERMRDAFSARTAEVKAATARFVATYGRQPNIAEFRNLVVQSRGPKGGEGAPAFEQWREHADSAGLTAQELASLRAGDRRERAAFHVTARRIAKQLTDPDSQYCVTKSTATVDSRTLRIAVAEAAQGQVAGTDVDRLIENVAASPLIVNLGDGHITTRGMLTMEHEVLARASAVSAKPGVRPSEGAVSAAVQAARVALSPEQQAAVRALCGGNALSLLVAPAGAGKGEVLRVVGDAYRSCGRRIVAHQFLEDDPVGDPRPVSNEWMV